MARPPGFAPPAIGLPQGGGAIRGIGEKFAANPVTGTGSLTIPLPASPGRSGFGPTLALAYDSGAAHGSFGMGWGVGLPAITRKTDKGLPTYDDGAERDVFVLSGAEDLVPTTGADGRPVRHIRTLGGRDHTVVGYRPRIEGLHARIERWTDAAGDVHWRSVSRDNVTTVYGKDLDSRIADPADPRRVFSWLVCESWDDRGNAVSYRYRTEDSAGVERTAAHEANRTDEGRKADRHLKSVRYGNQVSALVEPDLSAQDWHFELVFDYGEHDPDTPTADKRGEWLCRADPFSTHRAGFEIRNYRLCQRILMFHHFPDEVGVGEQCLVRSLSLSYRGDAAQRGEPTGAMLASVQVTGHRWAGDRYVPRALPPVEFFYSTATVDTQVHELDAASVANLPVGLDGPGYQWVDLDGESIAGVLTEQAGVLFYAANRGDGRLGPVRALPEQPVGGGGQLLDLGGDGRLDQVSFAGPTPGSFTRTDAADGSRGWSPHRPLRSLPAVDWTDPNLRFIDLNGDGRADLLVIEDDALVWYPSLGEDGFGPGIRMTTSADERAAPRIVAADRTQAIFVADLSGDGLTDLVRVRNGSVCYWPNLGHGRFGAQVVMDGPGPFDHPDRFDPRRVRLADVDGSGPSDLVYLGAGGVDLYANQLGNRWSAPTRIPAFPAVDDVATVSVVDLLGRGTACLTWSSPLPGAAGRTVRYVDLMGEKPNLLSRIDNNLGAETVLSYASSTTFYLADQAAGTPWITRLPFPVHVLTGVETYDRISRNRFSTSYAYHHGYFDGHEREFRGFGMVEQTDTEVMAAPARSSEFPVGENEAAATHLPPTRTRTWFHTGAHLDRQRISTLFAEGYYPPPEHATPQAARLLLPDSVLPPDLTVDAERDACRALKGRLLRREVYALDRSPLTPHPYTVAEHNYTVAPLAPGVFAVHPRDSVTIDYEREPSDPRVTHELVLAVDGYGTVLHSVALAYRRAVADAGLPERAARVQATTLVTETRTEVTALVDREDAFRVPVPHTTSTSEVTIPVLAAATAIVDRDDLLAELQPPERGRRLVERARTLFENDTLTGPLLPGEQGTRALVHETYRLVLSPELVAAAFGSRVDDEMLGDAGYVGWDGGWWAPSGTVGYAPAGVPDVLAYAWTHYFGPRRFVDPFGGTSAVELDGYDLQPVTLVDPVGNTVAARPDYRVLAPDLVTDPNGNQVQALFDALGLVVATAVLGTGDSVVGVDPEPAAEEFWEEPHRPRPGTALTEAHALLGTATTRVVHDLDAYRRTRGTTDPQPPGTATIARERHVRDADPSPVQVAVGYSDGMGREIQRKAQTAPAGWVASGWTVFNNKNLPVRQYEPFFTDTHRFEFAVLHGVSPTLCYDPVGRPVATLHPDRTWEKVVIGAWGQETWDAGDTVLIPDPAKDDHVGDLLGRLPAAEHTPTWYRQRVNGDLGPDEQTAAERTELHAATPTRAVLDPLGRPVLTVAHNRTPGVLPTDTEHRTHVVLDIEGNQLTVLDRPDTADRLVARYTPDLAGGRLVEESMEAGTRRALADVLGMPCVTWNHTDRRTITTYDAARRPVEVRLHDSGGEQVVGTTVYGESAPAGPDNLRGRVWEVRDGAGLVTHAYDLAGNPTRVQRQVTVTYRDTVDWASPPPLDDTWTAHSVFDALNRPTEVTHPDGTVVWPAYDRGGLLHRVRARLAGDTTDTTFVDDITYDAQGRRTRITHGNRVTTSYEYDQRTFRLRSINTRTDAGRHVQQLRYTYDPVGNVTQIRDEAQPLVFTSNALVEARAEYRYDAVYRLVEATGREHRGDGEPTTWDDTARTNPTDPHDLRRYTETYAYDVAGNMTTLVHEVPVGFGTGWTRTFTCAEPSQLEPSTSTSNRLTSTRVGTGPPERYSYDDHGNMLTLAPMHLMRWNHLDQLVASSKQVVGPGGVGEITYYVYDGAGERIRKVTDRAAATVPEASRRTERLYLGDFEIYREFAPSGAVTLARTTVHIHDGAGRVAMVDTRIDGGSDERLVRYQYSNHLDSAMAELDAAAESISYEECHPYGSTALLITRSGTPPKRYRYTGKERDEETGLNYHSARYLVPWLCRWASADPAGMADNENRYLYVRSNPVMGTDPSGTNTLGVPGPAATPTAIPTATTGGPQASRWWANVQWDAAWQEAGAAVPKQVPLAARYGVAGAAAAGLVTVGLLGTLAYAGGRLIGDLARGDSRTDDGFGPPQPIPSFHREAYRLPGMDAAEVAEPDDMTVGMSDPVADTEAIDLPADSPLLPVRLPAASSEDEEMSLATHPRDEYGQPAFESFHDVQLPPEKIMASDDVQMSHALKDLRTEILADPTLRANFTQAQLGDIFAAQKRMKLLVWHHLHLDVAILQLVDRSVHKEKGNHHMGSTSTTGRNRKTGGMK